LAKYSIAELNRKLTVATAEIVSRELSEHIAKLARDIIYKRVKSGYGVTSDSTKPESTDRKKLKPLSKSYKDQRKGLVKFFTSKKGEKHVYAVSSKVKGGGSYRTFQPPILGPYGSPTKSNLTMTGELLESISFSFNKNGFKLFISDDERNDGKLSNKAVADYVATDRPFFAITKSELNILRREISTKIRDIIRRQGL
jgi:hypothetical protein